MVFQYKNDRPLHFGSADIRVALYTDRSATYETATSIGMLDGVTFNLTGDETVVETDNHEDLDLGLSNQRAEIGASAWKNFDLEVFHKLLGQVGTMTNTLGGEQSVVDETVVLSGEIAMPLAKKTNGDSPTLVTSIVVKDVSGDTTYTIDTDYRVGITPNGYTTISRVSTGSIGDGDVVKVGYTYVATAAKTMTYSSSSKPVYLRGWLINTDEFGKKFIIELYKISAMTNANFSFGSDKGKGLVTMPVSIIAKPDATRPANDDLFSIYDEQGV